MAGAVIGGFLAASDNIADDHNQWQIARMLTFKCSPQFAPWFNHRNMQQMALAAFFFCLTAAISPPPPIETGDFCARLARDSGIDQPAAADGRTNWTVNALNFGQRFIFGGSSATGVSVKPVEPATVEDYRRLEDMCLPGKKSAVCKLVGPVNFQFIWKGQKILTPMTAGERATITIVSTKTTCQTEAP